MESDIVVPHPSFGHELFGRMTNETGSPCALKDLFDHSKDGRCPFGRACIHSSKVDTKVRKKPNGTTLGTVELSCQLRFIESEAQRKFDRILSKWICRYGDVTSWIFKWKSHFRWDFRFSYLCQIEQNLNFVSLVLQIQHTWGLNWSGQTCSSFFHPETQLQYFPIL